MSPEGKEGISVSCSASVRLQPRNASSSTGIVAWQKTLSRPLLTSQNNVPEDYALIAGFGMVSFKEIHTPNLAAPFGATSKQNLSVKIPIDFVMEIRPNF